EEGASGSAAGLPQANARVATSAGISELPPFAEPAGEAEGEAGAAEFVRDEVPPIPGEGERDGRRRRARGRRGGRRRRGEQPPGGAMPIAPAEAGGEAAREPENERDYAPGEGERYAAHDAEDQPPTEAVPAAAERPAAPAWSEEREPATIAPAPAEQEQPQHYPAHRVAEHREFAHAAATHAEAPEEPLAPAPAAPAAIPVIQVGRQESGEDEEQQPKKRGWWQRFTG
ncbi:MAG: hypothetical protein ACHQF3_05050, partial [Alphaproteobacteria bacterium]